jgi:hypothetical protein
MPVRFCVIATGQLGLDIAARAHSFAALDPVGRRVVSFGDEDFPAPADVADWTATLREPGAVVLRANGSLYRALEAADAIDGLVIEDAFAFGSE